MHIPVLLNEVLSFLGCEEGKTFIDCTLGDGGHTEGILKKGGRQTMVVGFDHDSNAIKIAKERLESFHRQIIYVNKGFQFLKEEITKRNIGPIEGIVFDLGVSSRQLTDGQRGFSFSADGPLDMRMDQRRECDAATLVNTSSQDDLTRIIRQYGEERWAAKIAANIVRKREDTKIIRTKQLAEIVGASIPKRFHPRSIHPATRTFQAFRIVVNDELGILEQSISDAVDVLAKGSRVCVISFHSLEDRIVKRFFRESERECVCDPIFPVCICRKKKTVRVITKKPLTPTQEEQSKNPRARSARLRVAEKI